MGSQSDYPIMKECEKILKLLKVKYQTLIVSAHRTPKRMFRFAETAEKNGFGVIVSGAGGAAHLPGMVASLTTLPVLGVPIETKKLKGLDSLLSMVQMPKAVPIGCLAIDGAFNAGLLAASIIGNFDSKVKSNLEKTLSRIGITNLYLLKDFSDILPFTRKTFLFCTCKRFIRLGHISVSRMKVISGFQFLRNLLMQNFKSKGMY